MPHPTKIRRRSLANHGLERKLVKYAIAGSAVLGAPVAANAGVIYSGVINQVVSGNPDSFTVSLLSGFTLGTNDYATFYPLGHSSYASVTGSTGIGFVDSATNTPQALSFGSLITTANATGGGGDLLKYGTDFSPAGYKAGNWPQNGSNAYLGMQYACSTSACTAWALINVSLNPDGFGTERATLVSYAYDTTPGESITAGQGAPEPSSLALFALGGGAALALLRRRRSSAAAKTA